MKQKFNKTAMLLSFICALGLPLAGCSTAGRNVQRPSPIVTARSGQNLLGNNLPNTATVSPSPTATPINTPGISQLTQQLHPQLAQDRQRAENIRKQLYISMSEISQANIIVNKDTAIIGFNPNLVKDANSTKTMLEKRVRQIDKSVKDVIVTDSADFINRMNQLSSDISYNKPVKEVTDKFNQLANSIKSTVKK